METMPEGSHVPPRSWWSRNWKWAAPLGGCLGLVAMCGCLGALVVGAGVSSLGKMEVLTDAVAIATADDEVRAVMGPPIQNSLPRQTSVQSVNGRTRARFTIPLDGAKADGVLRVDAEKDGEAWCYDTLAVEVEDGRRIDLRDVAPCARQGQQEPEPSEDAPEAPEPPEPPEPPEAPEPPAMEDGQKDSDIEL